MDSSSDADSMAAYFSQVSKTIQGLKIEKEAQNIEDDHDQMSICISTPHISSGSETYEKQLPKSKNKIGKDSKIDKIKLLEQKYRKRNKKSVSISLSDIEPEELLKNSQSRGELEAIPRPESPCESDISNINEVYDYSRSQDERIQGKEPLSSRSRSDTKMENLVSNLNIHDENEISERENLFYSTNRMLTRRKSSTSLLLNKDSIFHSSSQSTDNKPRLKRTNSVIKFSKYRLGDSGSAQSNSVPTESVEEEISATMNGRTLLTESKIDENVTGDLKRNSSFIDEKSPSSEQKQIGMATSKVSKKKIHNLIKGKTSSGTESGNRLTRNQSKKEPSRRKKTVSTRHRYKDPPSTNSATSQQSFSSSPSRSSYLPTKRKRKKCRDEEIKRTESILEVVLKNLPYVIRESMSGCFQHHSSTNLHLPQELCGIAASEELSWRTTNTRIDDALKQTIALTREFLDAHLVFAESYGQPEGYKYTSLKT